MIERSFLRTSQLTKPELANQRKNSLHTELMTFFKYITTENIRVRENNKRAKNGESASPELAYNQSSFVDNHKTDKSMDGYWRTIEWRIIEE